MRREIAVATISGLAFLDLLTTVYGISLGYVEENPFLHLFSGNFLALGTVMSLLKIFTLALSYFELKRGKYLIVFAVCGLFLYAVVSNFMLIFG
ncbi:MULTISPECIES: DUF5658 family protein [Acidianus]|nr:MULTISPECIES: DUF5658 family protein [Acidianus]NON63205.1 hypothetical protein [Acidianus sp. RZ1]